MIESALMGLALSLIMGTKGSIVRAWAMVLKSADAIFEELEGDDVKGRLSDGEELEEMIISYSTAR